MPSVIRPALAALLLAACAPAPVPTPGFRDTARPIYSAATLDLARLPGRWAEVARFADPRAPACPAGGVEIDASLAIAGRLCIEGRPLALSGVLRGVGPGRVQIAGFAEPWWVVWVDEAYRTLAIGTPSGRVGFILDRSGGLPEDRLRAAARIFDFNGYDAGRLVRLR